jgi:exosortase/archaeosortase family protein
MGARVLACVARGVAVVAGSYLLVYVVLPPLGLDLAHALNLQLARGATTVLRLIGYPVQRSEHVLLLAGSRLIVNNDCNSIGTWLLLAGAVFAVPRVDLLARLAGVIGMAVALCAINILRIAQLTYVNAYRPDWFSAIHEQIDPVILILVSVALYLAWIRLADRPLPA